MSADSTLLLIETDHVCNLREFKVLVASEDAPERWIPVLHSGLSNDSQPETFVFAYPAWADAVRVRAGARSGNPPHRFIRLDVSLQADSLSICQGDSVGLLGIRV